MSCGLCADESFAPLLPPWKFLQSLCLNVVFTVPLALTRVTAMLLRPPHMSCDMSS